MTKFSPSLKKALITAVSLVALAAAGLFLYRYQILQYSTEKVIRKFLPDYITIDKMNFNYALGRITFSGFRVLNPPDFSDKYMLEISEMTCRYKMKSGNILDGLELVEPVFKRPVLFIERHPDGRTNLQEMTGFLEKKIQEASGAGKPAALPAATADDRAPKDNNVSRIVKLPEDFAVKEGRVVFLDGMVRPGIYKITLDDVNAKVRLVLDSSYTRALAVSTTGAAIVNGQAGQTVKWDTKFDPASRELTMSNRFDVSGVDILAFRPYYDRYSPLVFERGYFSGSLIFDFDNGNIGSTNEVLLSKISFRVKSGYENASFLETTVPDLVKYFTSASGDIMFDFKIKGRMSEPQFYLGPISKQAVASMAIDKITQALSKAARDQANPRGAGSGGSGETTDIDKTSEYIDMFKNLLKEKR